MPEQNITLVNITELPTGTATLANPIMFGIGELLHTTTLEDIKTLMFTGVITEIPPNKIKIVNVFPDANFPENWEIDQLFAVSQAINYTLSTFYGGEITTEPNERIVFRLIQSSYFEPSPGVLIPNVLWRYYSETSGALSFTGISDPSGDIIPNGVIRNEPDDLIDLGDIGVATIESGFNTDPFAPFTMSGNSFVLATQNGEPKIWKWVGGDGLYGGVGTPSVSQDFLLLSQAPTDPLDYLPTKTITTTPYTVTFEDLNRPLIFTSNDQVVNIGTNLAELATNAGLTLFDFKAHFTGTGTHTINYPDTETWTGEQGALIYALCIDTSGDTVWIVKQFEGGGGGVPTGLEALDEGNGIGWRLIGRNPANYGNIGLNATDLSFSQFASSTMGATGEESFASGFNNIASGKGSHADGFSNSASGDYSHASGRQNIASGNHSFATGQLNRARAEGETAIGIFGTNYTPSNDGTDRLFNIGNGVLVEPDDAFTVFKNGAIRIFRATLASITNAAAGFLIFDSANANRPTIHNGTEWKGLAYVDEIPSTPTLQEVTDEGNETTNDVVVKANNTKGFVVKNDNGDVLARLFNDDGDRALLEISDLSAGFLLQIKPRGLITSTSIPLDNVLGNYNATPAYNATYTAAGAVAGGNATLLIDTTGQTVFPDVTGATLVTGSDFEAGETFEMHVYTLDGFVVRYFFLKIS